MKKLILTLLIIHCSLFIAEAQWFEQTLPVSGTINDIAFLNKDTGFVAMDNSNLLRTTNGGTNWEVIRNFRILDFNVIDNTTIYGSTPNGTTIYRTFDGGTNWDTQSPVGSICNISFVNRDTGWISSFSGIYKTTNGGVTANLISTENNCCTKLMMLKTPYNGEYYGWSIQAFSNGLFKTTNSGMNWVNISISGSQSVFFINKDTGWIGVGSASVTSRILYTSNGGNNWIEQYIDPNGYTASELDFLNSRRGWGGRGFFKVFATSNGGEVWGTQNVPIAHPTQLAFIDSLLGWSGASGLAKTINGGGSITYIGIDSNNIELPTSFTLKQNYPNPFNPQTKIKFSILYGKYVSFKIFDVNGKELFEEFTAYYNRGEYELLVDFSNTELASGIYFYRLTVKDIDLNVLFSKTLKMSYLK